MKNKILELIKKNKKYRNISDDLILGKLNKFDLREDLGKREIEGIVKEVRSELHKSYGSFQVGKKKRDKLFEKEDWVGIIKTNVSTKERLDYYKKIYSMIWEITGKPRRVVDLGCGLNIFSFDFMGLNNLEYYGYDISKDDINLINKFIKINSGLNGKAYVWDALSADLTKIKKCDVLFMFKLLESVIKNYKFIEKMILDLKNKCKYLVVSFATKKLSGKRMKYRERRWFEYMLERLGLNYRTFEVENETFYII